MAAYRRLEHFVEGPSNRLAYRSVCRLLEDPQHASPMSPLFLHGDCGVGKTHLLQAPAGASTQFSRIRYYSADSSPTNTFASVNTTWSASDNNFELWTSWPSMTFTSSRTKKARKTSSCTCWTRACCMAPSCCSLEMGTPIASRLFTCVEFSLCLGHGGAYRITGREHPFGHRQPLGEPPRVASRPRPPNWWWNGPSVRFVNLKALTRLDAMARLEGTGETIGLQLVTRTLGAAAASDRFDRPMLSMRYARP